ncbi:unnamed protein product [Knipowitschia caucasica]|uniref:Protein FAM161A n=1 Tax=Knipowitschia caucasica TaxID=637954 RepID=A0AAV2LQB9_KNICA
MTNAHRTNVLVTSCLKNPVDPRTKTPLASYERERGQTGVQHRAAWRDHEPELEFEDCGSDFFDEDYLTSRGPVVNLTASGDRIDLSKIFFSNEEYYTKLEELKKAHLRTMAELESMYRRKLQLKSTEADGEAAEAAQRIHWSCCSPPGSHRLRKSLSAVELRGALSDSSDEEGDTGLSHAVSSLQFSPKDHIRNMWLDFQLAPPSRRLSSSSLRSLDNNNLKRTPRKKRSGKVQEKWRHRVTVPEPFHMMLREDDRRKRGIKTRSEMEHENAELRRQLEELTECQRKFRASPVPAHVHLPLFEELQEKNQERRKRNTPHQHHLKHIIQKPFSFLERERLKKEQREREQKAASTTDQDKLRPFKAKPVPKSVYAAAAGDQAKEEQLYRSIKIHMRAQELLSTSCPPPSMLERRLSQRKKSQNQEPDCTHQPQINKEVPDFDASYRRFKKHLERHKEVKPTTSCEPFDLKTSQISSHRERILAELELEQRSPRALRWPYSPEPLRHTSTSSLCSSLSSSTEALSPGKSTSAARKRQEAVRKALDERRKADAEEEQWREKQRQREKRLQTVVVKRAQANDPHLSLSQTQPSKLQEFRKMDLQRKKEYQQEIKEMRQRVKGRPLLLEQVATRNAKQAAEKRFTEALLGCDVTQDFIAKNAAKSSSARKVSSSDSKLSDRDEPEMGYKPVHFRKIYLNEDGSESDQNENPRTDPDRDQSSGHQSEENEPQESEENYSDDHEEFSDDSREEEAKC